jgi:hypothetical protein
MADPRRSSQPTRLEEEQSMMIRAYELTCPACGGQEFDRRRMVRREHGYVEVDVRTKANTKTTLDYFCQGCDRRVARQKSHSDTLYLTPPMNESGKVVAIDTSTGQRRNRHQRRNLDREQIIAHTQRLLGERLFRTAIVGQLSEEYRMSADTARWYIREAQKLNLAEQAKQEGLSPAELQEQRYRESVGFWASIARHQALPIRHRMHAQRQLERLWGLRGRSREVCPQPRCEVVILPPGQRDQPAPKADTASRMES